MIPLYMDEHVPGAVTRGLRRQGADVVTAQEDGRVGAPDPSALDRATELGRAVFTQDVDFLAIAAERMVAGPPFSGVVYCKQRKYSIRELIELLTLVSLAGTPADVANSVYHLK